MSRSFSGPAFLLFAALAALWTWPLAANLSTRVPHDPGDPILNTWILWWNAQAVPFTAAWWSPPVLFPLPDALALSEHLAGLGVLATPIQLAGGGPLLAYNVTLIASYVLSGWFAFLLAQRLTGSRIAAVCTGMAFAFAPYRAGQLAHVQVLASQWMPAMLLALHAYVSTGRRAWLAAFGAAWLVQALSNGYYLLFLPVLLLAWTAWFVDWRTTPRRGAAIAIAWLIASIPLVPVLSEYRTVHAALGLSRKATEIVRFSATARSFMHVPPLLAFWPAHDVLTQEDYLFPGVTALALAASGVIGIALRRGVRAAVADRSPLIFYAAAAVLMWALALGPGGSDAGLAAWFRPYRWLSMLPGYEALRVPARFAMLASLCVSVAGGLALARLRSASFRARIAAGGLALAGVTFDGWMVGMPMAPPPPRVALDAAEGTSVSTPVIELPPDDARVSVAAMYRSIFHRQPLVNGYTGYVPPHYAILSIALRRGDPSPLLRLGRGHGLLIIVNDRPDEGAPFRPLVEELPGIVRVGASGAGDLYRLPPQPHGPSDAIGGRDVPAVSSTFDGERLDLDLESSRIVRGLTFPLRWRYAELPERLRIDCSDDSAAWRTVWLDWTGGPAVAAALEDPLVVPVRLLVPDVRARYLRIYPAPRWLARELRIITP